jgi:hypothetical protein
MAKQFTFTPQDHRLPHSLTLEVPASLYDKIVEKAESLMDEEGTPSTPEYVSLQALQFVFSEKIPEAKPKNYTPNQTHGKRGRPAKAAIAVA